MITFKRHTLKNGLKLIVHEDESTPLACFNLMYNVGSKDEDPNETGFAHLFEHLMFRGTKAVKKIDNVIENASGYLNAFTFQDATNYYEVLPANNIEIPFFIESDRMQNLAITKERLDAERNIVMEEFKQGYINKPYGDVWKLIYSQAYTKHPYNWITIGKELSHIENAKLETAQKLFDKYYVPNNAVLCVAGSVKFDEIIKLTEKYFGDIKKGEDNNRNLPVEPVQTEPKFLEVERDVPHNHLYLSFHIPERMHPDFYTIDVMTDILSGGESSRLYQNLVKEQKIFSKITATVDTLKEAGLVNFKGELLEGVDFKLAEKKLWEEIEKTKNELVPEDELNKVKIQSKTSFEFQKLDIADRALDLCWMEILGDANNLNFQVEKRQKITSQDIKNACAKYLTKNNSSTIYYAKKAQLSPSLRRD